MARRVVGVTLSYSIPVSAALMVFSSQLSRTLYQDGQVGDFIAALAPVVPLMYLDSAVDGMLKGLGEQTSYFVFNAVDSALRVALMLLFVPLYGTWAVVAVIILSELFNTGLSVLRLIKVTGMELHPVSEIILPCLCAAVSCLAARAALNIIPIQNIYAVIGIAALVYIFILGITKIYSKKLLLK